MLRYFLCFGFSPLFFLAFVPASGPAPGSTPGSAPGPTPAHINNNQSSHFNPPPTHPPTFSLSSLFLSFLRSGLFGRRILARFFRLFFLAIRSRFVATVVVVVVVVEDPFSKWGWMLVWASCDYFIEIQPSRPSWLSVAVVSLGWNNRLCFEIELDADWMNHRLEMQMTVLLWLLWLLW